jgi:hypothetical protein
MAGSWRVPVHSKHSLAFLEEHQAAGEIPEKLGLIERLTSDNPEQMDLSKSLVSGFCGHVNYLLPQSSLLLRVGRPAALQLNRPCSAGLTGDL